MLVTICMVRVRSTREIQGVILLGQKASECYTEEYLSNIQILNRKIYDSVPDFMAAKSRCDLEWFNHRLVYVLGSFELQNGIPFCTLKILKPGEFRSLNSFSN